jgi:hypothetical protein
MSVISLQVVYKYIIILYFYLFVICIQIIINCSECVIYTHCVLMNNLSKNCMTLNYAFHYL